MVSLIELRLLEKILYNIYYINITDCLNVLYIINKDFLERAIEIFDPRNAMYISRNDGYFDNQMNHQRDQIINMNTFVSLGKKVYTQQNLKKIYTILTNRKQKYGF